MAFDIYSVIFVSIGVASSITVFPAWGFLSAFLSMVTVSSIPEKNIEYPVDLLEYITASSSLQAMSLTSSRDRSEKYGVYQLFSMTVFTSCDCMSKAVMLPSVSILQSSPEVTA